MNPSNRKKRLILGTYLRNLIVHAILVMYCPSNMNLLFWCSKAPEGPGQSQIGKEERKEKEEEREEQKEGKKGKAGINFKLFANW